MDASRGHLAAEHARAATCKRCCVGLLALSPLCGFALFVFVQTLQCDPAQRVHFRYIDAAAGVCIRQSNSLGGDGVALDLITGRPIPDDGSGGSGSGGSAPAYFASESRVGPPAGDSADGTRRCVVWSGAPDQKAYHEEARLVAVVAGAEEHKGSSSSLSLRVLQRWSDRVGALRRPVLMAYNAPPRPQPGKDAWPLWQVYSNHVYVLLPGVFAAYDRCVREVCAAFCVLSTRGCLRSHRSHSFADLLLYDATAEFTRTIQVRIEGAWVSLGMCIHRALCTYFSICAAADQEGRSVRGVPRSRRQHLHVLGRDLPAAHRVSHRWCDSQCVCCHQIADLSSACCAEAVAAADAKAAPPAESKAETKRSALAARSTARAAVRSRLASQQKVVSKPKAKAAAGASAGAAATRSRTVRKP